MLALLGAGAFLRPARVEMPELREIAEPGPVLLIRDRPIPSPKAKAAAARVTDDAMAGLQAWVDPNRPRASVPGSVRRRLAREAKAAAHGA